jgi:hypothetical protein
MLAAVLWWGPDHVFAVEGDVEPNQAVDLRDLIQIRNNLGASGAPGFIGSDVNEDGVVSFADVLVWRQFFPSIGPFGPYLFIASPVDASIIGDRRPVILLDYSETFAPINLFSFCSMVRTGRPTSSSIPRTPC